MDPDRTERFSLQAALALAITAFLASAIPCLAPVEFLHSIEQSASPGARPAFDFGRLLAFAFMVSMSASLVTGLLAWGIWRYLLLPAGRLGFFPGAFAGAIVAALATTGFVFFGAQPVGLWTGTSTAEDPFTPAVSLVLGLGLSIPAAPLGGLVGGVVGSAQLRECIGGDMPRYPVRPPG